MKKLKGHKCPGEEICTTDIRKGIIVRDKQKTLDNFCHGFETKESDKELPVLQRAGQRRLYPGCALYPTKPETLPFHIANAIDAAEDLTELEGWGVLGEVWNTLTAWEVACFRVADRSRKTIDNEPGDENGENDLPQNLKGVPGQSTEPTEGMDW